MNATPTSTLVSSLARLKRAKQAVAAAKAMPEVSIRDR